MRRNMFVCFCVWILLAQIPLIYASMFFY
uniref:Uncharacterized protein n=1 Tax=Anguilla anguilla TaxID=7936 RepID=A0A0E9R9R9_ANGAN